MQPEGWWFKWHTRLLYSAAFFTFVGFIVAVAMEACVRCRTPCPISALHASLTLTLTLTLTLILTLTLPRSHRGPGDPEALWPRGGQVRAVG